MARLDRARRLRIIKQIPPKKCSGRSVRTGGPCEHWAMVGAAVCQTHGGMAKQVKAAAAERIGLAEMLVSLPHRPDWEILEDLQHTADVLYRDARGEVESGTLTLEKLDKLISSLERLHRLTTSNVNTGVAVRRQHFAEGQALQLHKVFTRVLGRLELTPHQQALVPKALEAEVRPMLEGEVVDAK